MSKKDLTAAFEKFSEKHTFKPGDIVEWKPGMKNKSSDGPYVVCEVLPGPVMDPLRDDSGSPYFREPLDLAVGVFDRDGDFVLYHVDSRRLQPAD